ncbi:ATP-binding protein [Enterococcus faecalis]|uniref:ATP-dependent nuclease n=1 Tax=Enterococcus faecalis TaxID=1351 RepID=UPI0019D91C09|nr:ATP-binding protein [Enterococcus faecalis]EGO6067285.1 ATP-binding protein [Enterococcus faecalis]
MYISKIKLTNFRCFQGTQILEFCEGMNFFVGNNNSGKTTIFKAIEFIQSGKTKENWISKDKSSEHVSVEIEFRGDDLDSLIQNSSLKKYSSYLSEDKKLIIMRSSEPGEWTDSKGKTKCLELKNIRIFNPSTKIFENPSGIDSTITALFDAQFVYSDLKNEDYQDFGKTKIVGKLINEVTKDFQQDESWRRLQEAHKNAFGINGLASTLKKIQKQLEEILEDQYGKTKVEFDFGLPGIENFLKTGNILLEENGVKTSVSEKGTGMQRALALSLIQLYSQIDRNNKEFSKPILFFIDEPETFLHPQAQDKLLDSLTEIANTSQVFITTHSPYLLKKFNKQKHQIKIFSRNLNEERVRTGENLNLFPFSPTWGEINYFAFGIVSEEFHNELFGYLHNKIAKLNKTYNNKECTVSKNSIKTFDCWLDEQIGIEKVDSKHQNTFRSYTDKTMPVYIRNYIDHPGSNKNDTGINIREKPTQEELRKSINFMIKLNNLN